MNSGWPPARVGCGGVTWRKTNIPGAVLTSFELKRDAKSDSGLIAGPNRLDT